MRELRKIWQDFSRAMPRLTCSLAVARALLTVRWVRVGSAPGRFLSPVASQDACAQGAVGKGRDALAFADSENVGAGRGQSWLRPGSAGEIHST